MGNLQDKIREEASEEGAEEVAILHSPEENAQILVNSLVADSRRIDINMDENINNLTEFQRLWAVNTLLRYGFPFRFRRGAPHEPSIFSESLTFDNFKQAKRDLTLIAIIIFSTSKELKEFWRTYTEYNEESILNWYLAKGNIYKTLNYSLQTPIPSSIQYCRLILRDLSSAITSKYLLSQNLQDNRLLYSEIYVIPEKWRELEAHIGKELKVDKFFSASKINQNLGNNNRENWNKMVQVTILMLNPPARILIKAIQGFMELENGNDILFNLHSKFTILNAENIADDGRHLTLLYGKYEMLKYLQIAQPSIAINKTHIYQKNCSQCQAPYERLLRHFFFVDLVNPNYFVCSGCISKPHLARRKTPLLLISPQIEQSMIPDGSEIPALSLPGLIVKYSEDVAIPFHGYVCRSCDSKELTNCFKCATCCTSIKEWCASANCQLAMAECLGKGHNIILERSPFTFWTKRPIAPAIIPNNNRIIEDEELETAQDFNKEFDYTQELENHSLKDVILIANSYCKVGCQYFEKEDYQTAKEFHLKALLIRKYVYGDKKHAHVAISYNNLGQCCFMLGEIDRALTRHTKAEKMREALFGQEHFATADSLNNVGMVMYEKLKDLPTALEAAIGKISQALKIRTRYYSYPHERSAIYNNNLAIIYSSMGPEHNTKAEAYYLKAQEIWISLGKSESLSIGKSYLGLGLLYKNQRESQTAASEFITKALEILKNYKLPSCDLKIAEGLVSLADLNKSQNRPSEAIDNYQEALGYYQNLQGDYNTALGTIYKNLAEISMKIEKYHEAKKHYLLLRELYEKTNNSNSSLVASKFDDLGFAFKRLEEYEEAKRMFEIAIEMKQRHCPDKENLIRYSINNLQDLKI